jgi:hypothetical protein
MTNHFIELRYSKDGGRNFSNPRVKDIGGTGQFIAKATFPRIGRGEQFIFEISDESPYRGDFIGASIHASSA